MRSPTNKHGFTLIELLVVIAIIALLIGILAPALSNARSQAKTIQCASQEKQIVIATTAYLVDFKDNIYWRTLPLDLKGMEWYYYGGTDDGTCLDTGQVDPADGIGLFVRPNRPLNPYTNRNFQLYHCPFDDKPLSWSAIPVGHTLFSEVGNCYIFNATGSLGWTDPTGLAGVKMPQVKKASKTIIYFDATMLNADLYNSDWHPDAHGNFAFLDGHSVYIQRPDYVSTDYIWDPLIAP